MPPPAPGPVATTSRPGNTRPSRPCCRCSTWRSPRKASAASPADHSQARRHALRPVSCMEAFLVSFGLVALAELGDKTQFLALMLASRFHRPLPILAGIFVAVVLNHLASAAVGYFIGAKLDGPWLNWLIAASFFAVAIWAALPEKAEGESLP